MRRQCVSQYVFECGTLTVTFKAGDGVLDYTRDKCTACWFFTMQWETEVFSQLYYITVDF